MKLSDQIRRMIKESPLTPYRIAKEAGVPLPVLFRFLDDPKKTLSLKTLDKIAPLFGGFTLVRGKGSEEMLAKKYPRRAAKRAKNLPRGSRQQGEGNDPWLTSKSNPGSSRTAPRDSPTISPST